MKTSVFICEGDVQLVLTPERGFERDALKELLPVGNIRATVYQGSFYECQGGYWRFEAIPYHTKKDDQSVILRAVRAVSEEPEDG